MRNFENLLRSSYASTGKPDATRLAVSELTNNTGGDALPGLAWEAAFVAVALTIIQTLGPVGVAPFIYFRF